MTNTSMASDAEIKPVKAIAIGLVLTIIVLGIISAAVAIVFAILIGADMADESFTLMLAENSTYLAVDLLVSIGILILSGYVAAKYVPSKELMYGMILGIITLVFYGVTFALSDVFSSYPSWYSVLSLLSMVPAVVLGAKGRIKT